MLQSSTVVEFLTHKPKVLGFESCLGLSHKTFYGLHKFWGRVSLRLCYCQSLLIVLNKHTKLLNLGIYDTTPREIENGKLFDTFLEWNVVIFTDI